MQLKRTITTLLALVVSGAMFLAIGTTNAGALPARPPKAAALPEESPWERDGATTTTDTPAEAEDVSTGTTVRVWRASDGSDEIWMQGRIPHRGLTFAPQRLNARTPNSPSIVVAENRFWVAYRGVDSDIVYTLSIGTGTPTTGGNFTFTGSSRVELPNGGPARTIDTPAVTEINGDLQVAWTNIGRQVLTSEGSILNHTVFWRSAVHTGLTTLNGPGLTNLGGILIIAYTGLNRRVNWAFRPSLNGRWFNSGIINEATAPAAWGRPAIMASGNMLAIAALGNDAAPNGGRSIWRMAYTLERDANGEQVLRALQRWTTDPYAWRSVSPVNLWAYFTLSRGAFIYMLIRGVPNNLPWLKLLAHQINRPNK